MNRKQRRDALKRSSHSVRRSSAPDKSDVDQWIPLPGWKGAYWGVSRNAPGDPQKRRVTLFAFVSRAPDEGVIDAWVKISRSVLEDETALDGIVRGRLSHELKRRLALARLAIDDVERTQAPDGYRHIPLSVLIRDVDTDFLPVIAEALAKALGEDYGGVSLVGPDRPGGGA